MTFELYSVSGYVAYVTSRVCVNSVAVASVGSFQRVTFDFDLMKLSEFSFESQFPSFFEKSFPKRKI